MIQIPDINILIANLIGKNYELLEDFKCDYFLQKGTQFTIKKIKGDEVTIKVVSKVEDIDLSIQYEIDRWVKLEEKDIKELERPLKVWDEHPEDFIIDKDNFWNTRDDKPVINTSYDKIPKKHPDKGHGDTIKTWHYKNIKGLKPQYSYQKLNNDWYSRDTYHFMIMGHRQRIDELNGRAHPWYKFVVDHVTKQKFSIAKLNKAKFKQI